jgi:hypothetical protein
MKIKKVNYRIVIATVFFLAAGAIPALATWTRIPTYRTPGYVGLRDRKGAEGGICGAPQQYPPCNSSKDQIFVNRYVAYTTSDAVRQNISSTAYLFVANGSSWVQVTGYGSPKFEGTCSNLAGGGVGGCGPFGSPSPEIEPGCPNTYTCTPAFYPLPADGHRWTVVVQVSWYNTATGALIAQAVYIPTGYHNPTNYWADIGCASFAGLRCRGPLGNSLGSIQLY